MARKLSTVNVIEMSDSTVLQMVSWADNEAGNKAAEKLFVELLRNHEDADTETIESYLEEGTYEFGHLKLLLVHSTEENEGKEEDPMETAYHAEAAKEDSKPLVDNPKEQC